MKLKVTVATLAVLMANNALAQDEPYYTYKVISVNADGANYGPYPIALVEGAEEGDDDFIATFSMKASLSSNIDIGLPFTFNRDCQYDSVVCKLEFYGSEKAEQLSYENAYQAWRNAEADAADGFYESYMMANTVTIDGDDISDNGMVLPFGGDGTTDVKVTDIYISDSGEQYIIGYSSAPYVNGVRDFVRRAFILLEDGTEVSLMPDFTTNGGFSSAYKIQKLEDGTIYVIGAASKSYPQGNSEYFDDCYDSDEDDDRYNKNDLVLCPGFDTQAWAWNVTGIISGVNIPSDGKLTGSELATKWLENNITGEDNVTYSASAFAMNSSGVAVGTSTFEYRNSDEGGRQRAIIMKPIDAGVYTEPTIITAATSGIDDEDDNIYNTWALTISEDGIVSGNREYDTSKGVNYPTEFFVYDITNASVTFPLLDKKVATTEQRADNSSYFVSKSGANSRVYDANDSGIMVGEVDDYDQTDPVNGGTPRVQAAFLYDNSLNQAWLMNDLICSRNDDGDVISPYIRINTARVISDSNVVVANGYEYGSSDDYINKIDGTYKVFKLTPNSSISPNESPNCWESDLHSSVDDTFERSGAAAFWLWIFALPIIFIRRFKR